MNSTKVLRLMNVQRWPSIPLQCHLYEVLSKYRDPLRWVYHEFHPSYLFEQTCLCSTIFHYLYICTFNQLDVELYTSSSYATFQEVWNSKNQWSPSNWNGASNLLKCSENSIHQKIYVYSYFHVQILKLNIYGITHKLLLKGIVIK